MRPGALVVLLSALVACCFAGTAEEAMTFYRTGMQLLEANQPFDALTAFSKAIAKNPKFADGYYGQGEAYSRTSRYPLAIKAYTEALALAPIHAGALAGRAFAHYFAEEYDLSASDFAAAVKADTSRADTIINFLFKEMATYRSSLKK